MFANWSPVAEGADVFPDDGNQNSIRGSGDHESYEMVEHLQAPQPKSKNTITNKTTTTMAVLTVLPIAIALVKQQGFAL